MWLDEIKGLRVITSTNNILNTDETISLASNTQEVHPQFKELVKRLKAGEKIPNIFLTDDNTIAFFIP